MLFSSSLCGCQGQTAIWSYIEGGRALSEFVQGGVRVYYMCCVIVLCMV